MTEEEKAETDILAILLMLSPEQRATVWGSITHNDTFCVHCGWGEIGAENPRCQCTNDE